jgi:hypothetical protein
MDGLMNDENERTAGPSDDEEERLEAGVEQIIVTRERTPRDPRWQRAWWHTLMRYNDRLARLRAKKNARDEQTNS